MITEELRKLYQSYTGSPAEEITELPSSGSNRRYFRIKGPETLIGVSGTSIEENEAFIYMAKHFREKGLPVPQVYASSDDHSFYIQEDLGDTLLFNAIEKGRKSSVFDEEEPFITQDDHQTPRHPVLGVRRFRFLVLPSASRVQPTVYPLGLELFQVLFLKGYRDGVSGKSSGR